mmetsp:Transcript_16968/g.34496  ORF Transcript_16968/g.34496 Transcript_16968/m.34496 type:complete len:340 (+) Transcript_16968:72-1091(+)
MSAVSLFSRCATRTRVSVRSVSHGFERLLRPNDLQASALDLTEVDVNLYLAPFKNLWVPAGGVGVFGGQVLGQCLHAASLTSEDPAFELHSLHAYFLRPGDATRDIVYTVKRTRDGRSFISRSVEASQRGRVIFKCSVSFHRQVSVDAAQLEHQAVMPDVPPPESIEFFDHERLIRSLLARKSKGAGGLCELDEKGIRETVLRALDQPIPVDVRWIDKNPANMEPRPAKQMAWIKTCRPLPDTPHLHRAVASFYSDYYLLITALLPHGIGFPSSRIDVLASLDHSMWFHAPFRADEWMLLEFDSPWAGGARGLSFARFYTPSGELAVSCAQEGLIRLKS